MFLDIAKGGYINLIKYPSMLENAVQLTLIITDFGDTRNNGGFPSKKGQTHRFAPTKIHRIQGCRGEPACSLNP